MPQHWRGFPALRQPPRNPGAGLGLHIVRQIACDMGGQISAANHPAGGAKVVVLLPLAQPPAPQPAPAPAEPPRPNRARCKTAACLSPPPTTPRGSACRAI